MAARTGKIARLPLKIREELNLRLLDGQSAGKILPWLNALPEVKKILGEDFEGLSVTDMNLSDWRSGGFAEWERKRERITRTRELAQYAAQHAKAGNGSITEGAQAIASGKLLELLETLDEVIEQKIDEVKDGEPVDRQKLSADALVAIAGALGSLRTSEQNDVRLAQNEKKLAQKDEELKLAREKFMQETVGIALKILSDDRAKSIEAGAGTNAEKIDLMGNHIFGDLWEKAKAIRDQKPK